ncbi:MAG TPA: CocE/NonD family hydrolase [Ktedonobacterales bacterium]|nr:CocE/NonD family hydrolase [Ktedonobacterales bacterium]
MLPQVPFGVRAEFDVPATMRDGVVLRANVFRPDDGGSGTYPVLLTRLPYGKDYPLGSSLINPAQVARLGYIVVVQDVRGTFTSGGDFYPMVNEGQDGADAVAWAARLPGSDGRVGMYGGSYMGFTQWAAARERPAALRAIAPLITWDDPNWGVSTRNGVLELGTQASWLMQRGLDVLSRRYRGDPQALGRALYGLAHEYDALPVSGYAELPLTRFGPLARLGLAEPMSDNAERHGDREFTAPARVAGAYESIDIPALQVAGWYDVFLDGTIRNFNGMRAAGRAGQYLWIGPWVHGVFNSVVGDVDFGFAAGSLLMDLQIDLVSLHLRFFDHYLKGIANGFEQMPTLKYFVMGANVWKSSQTWPPSGAADQRWYLHSGGSANTSGGDGFLSTESPATEPADGYVYDPGDPAPTVGGATLMHSIYRAGPIDQRAVEARRDVLVYTSAPLERAVEVAGPVQVRLNVATDAPDTDFVARLIDVYPDGRAIPLTDGITRMRYRNGIEERASSLVSGQVYAIDVDLWQTGNVFLPGHRIRVDVTSSNFPRWERNLNTGEGADATEMRPARQAILHDTEHPSYLELTIAPQ